MNASIGENYDVQIAVNFDGFGDAIRVARVIDVAGHAAAHRGVQDPLIVQAEHVDTAVLRLILFLSQVGQVRADDFADVFDDHLVLLQVSGRVQTQPLDLGPGQHHVLPPFGLHLPVLRALGLDKVLGVGSGRFEADQGRHVLLGRAVQTSVSVSRRRSRRKRRRLRRPLEIMDPFDVSPHLGLGTRASGRIHGQRQLEQRIPSVLESVIRQRFDPRQRFQHLDHVLLGQAE